MSATPEEVIPSNQPDRTSSDELLSLGGGSDAMSAAQDHHTKKGGNNNDEDEEIIARAETRCVLYLRILTFGFLASATICVAFTVRHLMRRAEWRQLERTFHDNADKVLEAVGTILRNTFTAVDEFSVSMTSFANAMQAAATDDSNNSSWPFVTIPDFAVRASKLRSLSKIFLFTVYHCVRHEERAAWEAYTATNKGWIDEGIQTQKTDKTFRGILIEEWESSDQINFYGQRSADAELYTPRWQSSPVLTRWDPHSWNAYQEPLIHEAMDRVIDHRGIVISTSYNIDETNVYGLQDFVGDVQHAQQPAVELYSPVLNDTSGSVGFDDRKDADLVAIMGLSIFWHDLIEGILPIGNNGLVAVFDNAGCNQTFTFQINGPDAEYLGAGDLHDPDFDFLMVSSSLRDLTRSFSKVEEVYSGPPLNEDFCSYSLRLYSSKAMAEDYITSDPMIFAFLAVAIFIFTSIVFLVYDTMIEKRQRKVMLSATRSSAIVSSLFPSTFRNRLYQESTTVTNKVSEEQNQRKRMQNFMIKSFQGGGSPLEPYNTEPIADLFESTTVLFADIKGFTKWSSSREPTQVFTLLETLYGAYDGLAEKWGVYKIETIGDSYVAVCGLPEPREDHAVAMTKFAVDMRRKTKELVEILRETLGEGTEDLEMRIGMHSGATTGGVLRGKRARFQLFGDTVNTAARMESNGEGSKIQVSQATADLLVAGGKGAWLEKRKDLVKAKGKGEMQTFWVEPITTGFHVI